jgi:hypothetical protein
MYRMKRCFLVLLFVILCKASMAQTMNPESASIGEVRQWPPFTDYVHFLFSGQSLSIGAQGLPILSTTQPYDNKTFEGGPRSQSYQLNAFIDLVEFEDGTRGETPCSGAANYVVELAGAHAVHDMISSTVGEGGYKIRQLNKGSAQYQLLLDHVQAGMDLSGAEGKTYSVRVIGWLQGESDQVGGAKPRLEYKNDLIEYQQDVDHDVKAITGQVENVPLISYQLSCYVARGGNYRNVTLAQLDACEESERITLCSPTYPFPYNADLVHMTNIGYLWVAHYFGKVYHDVVVERKPWMPLSMKSIVVQNGPQGDVVIVEFHVPEPPLVLDTTNLPAAQDYGFVIEDDAGRLAIKSVEVIEPTKIRIIVNRKLTTNPRLRYALDYLGPGMLLNDGASGNLRDSDSRSFLFDTKRYRLYNWCVAFDKHFYLH